MLISSISVLEGLVVDACPKQEDIITTIRFFFLGHRRLSSSYFTHQSDFPFLFFIRFFFFLLEKFVLHCETALREGGKSC